MVASLALFPLSFFVYPFPTIGTLLGPQARFGDIPLRI